MVCYHLHPASIDHESNADFISILFSLNHVKSEIYYMETNGNEFHVYARARIISVLYKSTVFIVVEEHRKIKMTLNFNKQNQFSSLIGNELEFDAKKAEILYVNKDC